MSGNKKGCASAGQSPLCVGNRWADVGDVNSSWTPPTDDGRVVLGDFKVSLSDEVSIFDAIPVGANHAEIHVWGAGVVWTISGVDPDYSAQIGHRTGEGGSIELESAAEVAQFKAVQVGDGSSLHVTFFKLDTHIE